MPSIRYEHRDLDVACDLQAAQAEAQVGEWQRLQAEAGLGCEPIAGGMRLWLRPEAWDKAVDFKRAVHAPVTHPSSRRNHRRQAWASQACGGQVTTQKGTS
jgi:hypothetical protein